MNVPGPPGFRPWRAALLVFGVALALRLAWIACVPTIAVGDFATYRESAQFLVEHGRLDDGFIYMPSLVLLLAGVRGLGGELLADKVIGAFFGALTGGALTLLTAALATTVASRPGSTEAAPGVDADADAHAMSSRSRSWSWPWPWPSPSPSEGSSGSAAEAASAARWVGGLYLLWLPGLATASVVGTDGPCAAMICLALAGLCHGGRAHPVRAAVLFGATMGLAAYFRAVALPLVVLSAGYWLALRVPLPQVLERTGLAILVTLFVLSPWALRNWAQSGHVSFTDSHGGVTALMGNDPNTEGTYSRTLQQNFRRLTGRSFLSRPHAETDRVAYALARRWIAFEPAFTLGMVGLRLERLLAPERGLLYWSIFRPGILPPGPTATVNRHRATITAFVDAMGVLLAFGLCCGVAFACGERRLHVLVPLVFASALLVTYALFVAEPRYRLASEFVAFPVAAFGLSRLSSWAHALVRVLAASARGTRPARPSGERVALRPLWWLSLAVATVALGTLVVVRGGAALRARHRWAFSVSAVFGRATPTYFRSVSTAAASAPPAERASHVRGSTDGVYILAPRAQAISAAPGAASIPGETLVAVTLHDLSDWPPGMTPATPLVFQAALDWSFAAEARPPRPVAQRSTTADASLPPPSSSSDLSVLPLHVTRFDSTTPILGAAAGAAALVGRITLADLDAPSPAHSLTWLIHLRDLPCVPAPPPSSCLRLTAVRLRDLTLTSAAHQE